MSDNFNDVLKDKVSIIENEISKHLPKEEGYAITVIEAMNYSVNVGGKRLRPMLMLETYRLISGEAGIHDEDYIILPELSYFMTAIELIHTYSLVHDDLPAMDNDEYRRGKYTTWKVYGDGMGVLAGDGLLNFAFETMTKACLKSNNPNALKAMSVLGKKAGIYGMIGGQCADLDAEGRGQNLSSEQLLYIHEHKTGCLIEAALMVGALLAGASQEVVDKLEKIGSNIGLAFQIQDDILDVEGDSAELGKPVGSDEENEKLTYVSLYGMEKSKKDVELLSAEAERMIDELPGKNDFLKELIMSLARRRK